MGLSIWYIRRAGNDRVNVAASGQIIYMNTQAQKVLSGIKRSEVGSMQAEVGASYLSGDNCHQ